MLLARNQQTVRPTQSSLLLNYNSQTVCWIFTDSAGCLL